MTTEQRLALNAAVFLAAMVLETLMEAEEGRWDGDMEVLVQSVSEQTNAMVLALTGHPQMALAAVDAFKGEMAE